MLEFISVEFLQIVGSGIGLGVAGNGAYDGFKRVAQWRNMRAPLRKFYAFNRRQRTWIILSGIPSKDPTEFFSHSSPIDGVYSYGDLSNYFSGMRFARAEYDTRFAADLGSDSYKDNLILIGGYEHNQLANNLNKNKGRSFYFENNTIIERVGGRRWAASINATGHVETDYCLITRMSNPYMQSTGALKPTLLVAFEGVRHFGTIGGVRYADERIPKTLREIKFSVTDNSAIELVVEFDVLYPSPSAFSISSGKLVAGYENGNKLL
jgi:hypothetical protein